VLVSVDDAQWADGASLRFLAYLARRVTGLPVLLMTSVRSGAPSADARALSVVAAQPETMMLRPAPLSGPGVASLVRATLAADADEVFCAACQEATVGNPFLLRELLTALRAAGVHADASSAREVGRVTPATVACAVRDRLAGLGATTGEVATAIAVLGGEAELATAARLAGLAGEDAASALDALVAAELLVPGARLDFVHPIVRRAVYETIPVGRRGALHDRAARLLGDAGAAADQLGAHLLTAPAAGERRTVEQLLDASARASAEGAPELAARFAWRALHEPPEPDRRATVLRALGNAETRLGDAAAIDHLLEAFGATEDASERSAIALDLAFGSVPGFDPAPLIERALAEIETTDRELSLRLYGALVAARGWQDAHPSNELDRAARLLAKPATGSLGERFLSAQVAFAAALDGRPAEEVVELAARALGDAARAAEDAARGYPLHWASVALTMVDRFNLAAARVTGGLRASRARGSLRGVVIALNVRAFLRLRRGALVAAETDAEETFTLLAEHGDHSLGWGALPELIEVLVERGALEEAERRLAGAPDIEAMGAGRFGVFGLGVECARGTLRFTRGETSAALADFLRVGDTAERLGVRSPAWVPWRSRAALARLALGDRAGARVLAEEELRLAERIGAPTAIGVARRTLGHVHGGATGLAELERAIGLLARSGAQLEHARALVDLGAALRRSRRRSDAREPLAQGRELAHRCGARVLAERARTELLAAGARPRRIMRSGLEALTPSERRVAELAAAGRSNRQIAQALFVTVKTVEHQLGAAYGKLGIASRAQLATALQPPP